MTGGELRELRLDLGWSQRELARQAGIDHGSVQYWERQEALDPTSHAIPRIVAALKRRINGTTTRARYGVLDTKTDVEFINRTFTGQSRRLFLRLASRRVICGAKTRKGTPCKARSVPGKKRCKFHGGLSTGPKTVEGRARIAEAQRRRRRSVST